MRNIEYSSAAVESAIYNVIVVSIQEEVESNPITIGPRLVITKNGISMGAWPGSNGHPPSIVSGELFERLKSAASSSDLLPFDFANNSNFNVEVANLPASGANGDVDVFWSNFKKQFPSANGYYAVSHVAINDDGDHAAALIAYYCPAFCGGFGGVATFKRINNQWSPDEFHRYWAN